MSIVSRNLKKNSKMLFIGNYQVRKSVRKSKEKIGKTQYFIIFYFLDNIKYLN